MATSISYNGNSYSVPAYNDTGYAQGAGNLPAYLVALATGSLTLAGGTFTLTADVNFGGSFGLVALYLKSVTANIASAGFLRLAKTDLIDWRNNANGANLPLGIDSSDRLTFNSVILATNPLAANFAAGGFKLTGLAAGSTSGDSLRYEQLIGLYLLLAGGTMSGAIAMGTNKITGLGNGTAAQDAVAFTQLKVIQIVNGTGTTATSTTSTTFVDTNLTATITPSSASNKILVLVSGNVNLVSTTINLPAFVTIFGAGADIGTAGSKGLQVVYNLVSSATSRITYPINMNILHSPATTSPTTYVVEIRVDSAALTVAWGQGGDGTNMITTITLLEVVA